MKAATRLQYMPYAKEGEWTVLKKQAWLFVYILGKTAVKPNALIVIQPPQQVHKHLRSDRDTCSR